MTFDIEIFDTREADTHAIYLNVPANSIDEACRIVLTKHGLTEVGIYRDALYAINEELLKERFAIWRPDPEARLKSFKEEVLSGQIDDSVGMYMLFATDITVKDWNLLAH